MVFIPGLYQGSIPHLRAEDTDEERRLLYVAMTRAQSLLYLSFPSKGSNNGMIYSLIKLIKDNHKLSMFVEDPKIQRLLATRGGVVDVEALATILNRPVPTSNEIAQACTQANLYIRLLFQLIEDLP